MQRPFPAYRGNDPYVFVSYAHADARAVYAELSSLREAGFNVWYDEGISPGSRWTDDLAERIANAALVILFVTPSAVRSENCRNEIDYALDQQRRILLVHLKPTELPGGMKLALSGRQAILKDEHAAAAYREKFLESVAALVGSTPARDIAAHAGRRRGPLAVLVLAVVVLVGGVWFWAAVRQEPVSARTEPLPLLIADFDNRTGEAVFDGVLEEALRVGMEGAPFVASYPREDAARILPLVRGGSELTHEGARLVAMREGLELVLAGVVAKSEGRYLIRVDGLAPLDGSIVTTTSERAASALETLNAIATVAARLREQLGDVRKREDHLDERFTAASLEAASVYAAAQALAADWKHADAIPLYARAVELDPALGRAYGGWAYSAHALGRVEESAQQWDKCLALLHTMTERERLRTLGIYYMTITGNQEKAAETFHELSAKYPADAAALNNLAVAQFSGGNFEEARDTGAKLLGIFPNSLLYLANYALYNLYIADLEESVAYARRTLEKDPTYYLAYLPLAIGAMLERDNAQAERLYGEMAATGEQGASFAAHGLADLALARGDKSRASALLADGVVLDETAGNRIGAVTKRLSRARALIGSDRQEDARQLLDDLSDELVADRHEFEYAELRIAIGDRSAALATAGSLAARIPARSRAYGAIVRGLVSLDANDYPAAIDALKAASDLRDSWLVHFNLGIAYLNAGYPVEAMDELDLAWRRRGESFAVFLDDVPSFERYVTLLYWRGRALDAIGRAADARASYEEFLARRNLAGEEPAVRHTRDRIAALGSRTPQR